MHKAVIVTEPSVEPISLDEAKDHLNVRGSTKDVYIEGLRKTARRTVERYLNRALITQSWKVYYDRLHDHMKIPFGSLQVTAADPDADPTPIVQNPLIKYYDLDGTLQTLAENQYWVVKNTDPACIVRAYDVTYPETQYGRPDVVEIAFTCGYGATPEHVPAEIKHAMKLLITNWYEHRGDIVITNFISRIPSHVTDLIHGYKLYYF